MRAIRLVRGGAPLEERELPEPVPGPGEVLVDVHSAGVCHSDAHYRADASRVRLPITLGHEVAGVVAAMGAGVEDVAIGSRVALHYLWPNGDMIGKERDGGYAERIVVPAGNVVAVPAAVPLDQAAIMMCSTSTALHALRVAPLGRGESVAIVGFGGLGISALQLARALGASRVYAIDPVPAKRERAAALGATAVPLDELSKLPEVDVALDFAGHEATTLAVLRRLATGGRLVLVAINLRRMTLDPYADVLGRERRLVGCSDHTRDELVELMALADSGAIDPSAAISRRIPLEAAAIDAALDDLERGTAHLRTVIAVR
ncbi:MAG TPA: alcohol dehydrogenase catalytic domain-containing protein [Thermoanaerobaculia bacterium]|nr:alcohol dehydrogenase catalytic domain-containing protein [Thermoanaerobaculia bacterium]